MKRVLILGIGNVLWADEGFGVRAVEALQRAYRFPENVTLMDGGTQGLNLIQYVGDADILIIFDAVDYGLLPGTLKTVADGDVPSFLGAKKMSLHQTGFQEVLAMARLLGKHPEHILLIGVQPAELEDYGGSLRPPVKKQIGPAMAEALRYLQGHGVTAEPRAEPLPEAMRTTASSLDLETYENGRPSAEQACRIGDPRILYRAEFPSKLPASAGDGRRLCVDVDHRGKY